MVAKKSSHLKRMDFKEDLRFFDFLVIEICVIGSGYRNTFLSYGRPHVIGS